MLAITRSTAYRWNYSLYAETISATDFSFVASSGCTRCNTRVDSQTIAPFAPRHWPDASGTLRLGGKRGVTIGSRKRAHSSGVITPFGFPVPKIQRILDRGLFAELATVLVQRRAGAKGE